VFTRQNPAGHDFSFLDGLRNSFVERPGVADASHAAVADDMEAQSLKIRDHAGFSEVVRYNATSCNEMK
jgi:hypothetical protein